MNKNSLIKESLGELSVMEIDRIISAIFPKATVSSTRELALELKDSDFQPRRELALSQFLDANRMR